MKQEKYLKRDLLCENTLLRGSSCLPACWTAKERQGPGPARPEQKHTQRKLYPQREFLRVFPIRQRY